MSDVKRIATRNSYGSALVEIGKEHEELVVLDADLAGSTQRTESLIHLNTYDLKQYYQLALRTPGIWPL